LTLTTILSILSLTFIFYVVAAIEHGTLFVPVIAIFLDAFNPLYALVLLFFVLVFPKLHGYAISDEGVGTVKVSKYGWQYVAYVKWEDVIAIEFKRSIFFGTKNLLIHSNNYVYKKKKVLYINSSRRDFNEIVRIVSKKNNSTLLDLMDKKSKNKELSHWLAELEELA
jgi:hypothetical protein